MQLTLASQWSIHANVTFWDQEKNLQYFYFINKIWIIILLNIGERNRSCCDRDGLIIATLTNNIVSLLCVLDHLVHNLLPNCFHRETNLDQLLMGKDLSTCVSTIFVHVLHLLAILRDLKTTDVVLWNASPSNTKAGFIIASCI